MSNKKQKPIGRPRASFRWSPDHAAREFGCDRRTIEKNLARESIEPGEDGKFSTAQIVSVMFGDQDAADLRLTLAQAEQIERKNRVAAGRLVDVDAVIRFNEQVAAAMRERVLALDIPHTTKESLLGDLQKLDDNQLQRSEFSKNQEEDEEGVDAPAEPDADAVG